jgi:hypothetical protein
MFLGGTCSRSPFLEERELGTIVMGMITSTRSIESSFLHPILSFEAYHFLKNDGPQFPTEREGIPRHGMASLHLYG